MASDLRLSDWAGADDVAPGRARLWLCTAPSSEPDERECLLVLARSAREARGLAAASRHLHDDGSEDEGGWVASVLDEAPFDMRRILGVWDAPEPVWARYGIAPSEDWRECGCCGVVSLVDDRWTRGADECDDCDEPDVAPEVIRD